jgi:fluoride exporter
MPVSFLSVLYSSIAVGLGGLLGSLARFGVGVWLADVALTRTAFPIPTFAVNLVGCFVIAFVSTLFGKYETLSSEMRLFLTTGFCGGFTTFSALVYETHSLYTSGNTLLAALYVMLSLLGGLVMFYLGARLAAVF